MINENNKLDFDFTNIQNIQTNLIPWDIALGGGIEIPSIIQLAGDSSSGKTTLAIQLSSILSSLGKTILYLDVDGSITKEHLINLNLYNNQNFIYVRECSFKEAENRLDSIIRDNNISLIIIDSITNLINPCYLDLTDKKKESTRVTNYNTNNESRPLGLFIKKYKSLCMQKNISLLIVNQYRNKIHKTLGTIKKRFGPKILDYSCTTILQINNAVADKNFKVPNNNNGSAYEFEVIKSNKVLPKTHIPFYLEYGKGINPTYNLLHKLIEKGFVKKNGTYYEIPQLGITSVNGIENLINELSKFENTYKMNYSKNKENAKQLQC